MTKLTNNTLLFFLPKIELSSTVFIVIIFVKNRTFICIFLSLFSIKEMRYLF